MPEATVLIVDDEPLVREILSRYLTREGFAVDDGIGRPAGAGALAGGPPRPGPAGPHAARDQRAGGLSARTRDRRHAGDHADGEGRGGRPPGRDWRSAPTTTSPSRSRRGRSSPGSGRCFAGARRGGETAPGGGAPIRRHLASTHGVARFACADRPVSLTRREFELFLLLASNPGTAFSRAELLDRVWDFAWAGDSSTVTVHIRRLREKIEADPSVAAAPRDGLGRRLPVRSMSGKAWRPVALLLVPAAAGAAGTLLAAAAAGMHADDLRHILWLIVPAMLSTVAAILAVRMLLPRLSVRQGLATVSFVGAAVALANLAVLSAVMFVSSHDATVVAVFLVYSAGAGVGAALALAGAQTRAIDRLSDDRAAAGERRPRGSRRRAGGGNGARRAGPRDGRHGRRGWRTRRRTSASSRRGGAIS